MNEHLLELLNEMNVPEFRKNDLRWLARNLGIYNGGHPNYEEARILIQEELRKESLTS